MSGADYNVILLFESLLKARWREMTMFEGQHVELFARDTANLAYSVARWWRATAFYSGARYFHEGLYTSFRSIQI